MVAGDLDMAYLVAYAFFTPILCFRFFCFSCTGM